MAMVLIIITGGQITPEVEVPPTATVLQAKERIEERLNIEVHRQSLWADNIELQNHETVENHVGERYGMLRLSVTPSSLPKCNILLKFPNQSVGYVRIKETCTVDDLRSKIGRRWGIVTSDRITLFHRSTEMLSDRPLSAYYITDDSEVEVKIETEAR